MIEDLEHEEEQQQQQQQLRRGTPRPASGRTVPRAANDALAVPGRRSEARFPMERLRGRPRAELAGPRRILRRSQGPRGIEGNRETDAGTRGEDRGLAGELDRQTTRAGERGRERKESRRSGSV